MAAPLFAKRARPGMAGRVGTSDDADGGLLKGGGGSGSSATVRKHRQALSLDEGDGEETFKVKKSKLSRQMAAARRGKPAGVGTGNVTGHLRSAARARDRIAAASGVLPDFRDYLVSSDEDERGEDGKASMPDVAVIRNPVLSGSQPCDKQNIGLTQFLDGETLPKVSIILPGDDGDDEGSQSGAEEHNIAAARLARQRRAAARELYGSSADGGATVPHKADYIPLVANKATLPESATIHSKDQANSKLALSSVTGIRAELSHEGDDAGDDWALQQMRVGIHRLHSNISMEDLDARMDAAGTGVPVKKSADFEDVQPRNTLQSPTQAMAELWETLRQLEGGAGDQAKRRAELNAQQQEAADELRRLESASRGLDQAFKAAQGLEDSAWNLGGLLDSKGTKLKQASQMLARMEQDLVKRRSQRRARRLGRAVQSAGATLTSELTVDLGSTSSDACTKRAGPRKEQRRRTGFKEGWETSSASEGSGLEWASDRSAFCAAAHKQLAADVAEEFASAAAALRPLQNAKKRLGEGYTKAFVSQSLPEALSLFIERSLLWWDPLELCSASSNGQWGPSKRISGSQLEEFDWFSELAAFSAASGDDDPDAELVPQLVQRCVFPEVVRRLKECWDITSSNQTARVTALLDECVLFDDSDQSASTYPSLLDAAASRLEQSLTEQAPELFVPDPAVAGWYASDARRCYLCRCCKIATCALSLDGRLQDEKLARFVLSAIFQRRMAPHLRAPRLDPQELAIVARFVEALPERWLEPGLPPMLGPLRDALGPRAPAGPEALATAEVAARVLQRLQCHDEAQALLRPVVAD